MKIVFTMFTFLYFVASLTMYAQVSPLSSQRFRTTSPQSFLSPGDGTGTASASKDTVNAGESHTVVGFYIFGDGVNTLEGVQIVLPPTWIWSQPFGYTLFGNGSSGSTLLPISGDGSSENPFTITIENATITNFDYLGFSFYNLTPPYGGGGSSQFIVRTRVASGTFTNIASSPMVAIRANDPGPFDVIASGNWNSGSIWRGGVPPTINDNVTIASPSVVVTLTDGAECNNLLLSGNNSVLQYPGTGSTKLTVNGTLCVSSYDTSIRPALKSNGNSNATLNCHGDIISTVSNSPVYGNKGISMNEGNVVINGAGTNTIITTEATGLANLTIGDGVDVKILYWDCLPNSPLIISSLTVKTGSTFVLGSPYSAYVGSLGNSSTPGLPMLTGGITIENGGSLAVTNGTGDYSTPHGSINLKNGGIINNGSLYLSTPARNFDLTFGGLPADLSGSNQVFTGAGQSQLAQISLGKNDTLTVNADMYSNDSVCYLGGRIIEIQPYKFRSQLKTTRKVVPNVLEDFGGIGFTIKDEGTGTDTTTIYRDLYPIGLTNTKHQLGGNSVERFYQIFPKDTSGLDATIELYFRDDELGVNDPYTLSFYMKRYGSNSWVHMGGVVDTLLRKVTLTGVTTIPRGSYWAISDDDHPLDMNNYFPQVSKGWNLVSLLASVPDNTVNTIYGPSYRISDAFAYAAGYHTVDTLANGMGYWVKFNYDWNLYLRGRDILTDTIHVNAGWNLIGSISVDVPTNSITSNPPGLVTSQFFEYNHGYVPSDIIAPGKGYWVKANSDGDLILSSTMLASKNNIKIIPTNELPPSAPSDNEVTSEHILPKEFSLSQNYPNPFNPSTVISYQVSVKGLVSLKVYNTLGEDIATLVNEIQDAGFKSVTWDASKMPSGVYYYRLQTEGFSEMKKMLLAK